MPTSGKITNFLLYAGYALCLLQIWLPDYYLTGDGPCHLYNAQILHDILSGNNRDFYSRFFDIVGRPNPNWMSHLLLAGLLYVVKGVVAEKILLTGYVILFVSGFSRLLKRLDADNSYWQLVVFAFVFHYVLAKGFYNFSISVALLFWMIDWWLRVLDKISYGSVIAFFIVVCLTFFAHPVAFVFGAFCCAALTVSALWNKQHTMMPLLKYSGLLIGCILPCSLFMIWFAADEAHEGTVVLHVAKYKVLEFADFNCLVNLTVTEVWPVRLLWLVLVVGFIYALIIRMKSNAGLHKYDGFLAAMLFAGFLYFFFPDKLFGGSLFVVRAQYLWGLFMVCAIGYMLPAGWVKNGIGLLFLVCFIGLSVVRMACLKEANAGLKDLLSARQYIKPNSVVLPLDFAPGGLDMKGNIIADRNWIFSHAAQYMALNQPLIMMDNYEANTGYFPLIWKGGVNPYLHLCQHGSIEHNPPFGNITDYKSKTGVTIDCIVMWCHDSAAQYDTHFDRFYSEIRNDYNLIYTSANRRVKLLVHK